MASTTLSGISGRLKRVYDTYLESTQNLSHKTIDLIGKSAKKYNPGGEGFFGAINDYGNESGGAISEDEAFRSIDSENEVQWKVTPKVNVWPIEFTGLAAAAAEDDEESFAETVVYDLDRAKERLLSDENRQFFGMGTGLLASPSASVASNLLSFTVDSVQYLRKNMVIDIFTSTTKTVDSKRISRVDPVNKVVHLSTSLGAAIDATCEIVKENIRDSAASDGKEMMGLRGIVDNGTDLTTFQNINASTNDEWQSVRIDASSGDLTSDMLQRLEDDVMVASGQEADTYITHPKQRRKYLDLVTPEKRFMDGKMDAGFTELTFNGKKFLLDKDCQRNVVYLIKKAALRKFELQGIAMGAHDGSDPFLRLSGYDKFQAYWRHYCNFGTGSRKVHGKIVSLAVPAGRD